MSSGWGHWSGILGLFSLVFLRFSIKTCSNRTWPNSTWLYHLSPSCYLGALRTVPYICVILGNFGKVISYIITVETQITSRTLQINYVPLCHKLPQNSAASNNMYNFSPVCRFSGHWLVLFRLSHESGTTWGFPGLGWEWLWFPYSSSFSWNHAIAWACYFHG